MNREDGHEATAAIAYHTNLLFAALSGRWPDPFAPAPCGGGWSWASSAERIKHDAIGAAFRDHSRIIANGYRQRAPRALHQQLFLAQASVTCPIVGSSDFGLITAVTAFNANAFAFAVENVADPRSSVATGIPPSSFTVAAEEAASRNRAACGAQLHAARVGRAQIVAVKNRRAHGCARSADTRAAPTTQRSPERPQKRPRPELISKQDVKIAATISRERAIEASKRATRRILTAFPAVNKDSPRCARIFCLVTCPPPLAVASFRCYNACQHMADWKQITARIRRARTGKDPVGQLSNLYEKTRDAMVAFELARYFETAGQNPEAAKWYLAAADRFRSADWKTKAQEAAVRLGAEVSAVDPAHSSGDFMLTPPSVAAAESVSAHEENSAASETLDASAESETETEDVSVTSAGESADSPDKKRRRRGRRGGRNRRKGEASKGPAAVSTSRATESATPRRACHREYSTNRPSPDHREPPRAARSLHSPSNRLASLAGRASAAVPAIPVSPPDCLFSKCSLRRLLTCAPVKLSEADHAPVGPGVFVLTDSDLTSYYYVEACQTLRIAVGNLLRGGASRRGADSLKPQLAEHLGIPESRVTKYLADHCVVRWLQLDEGASHFAHFVTAVIRPTLNE